MNVWTFIGEHFNGPADWVLVLIFMVAVIGMIINKVAAQPYFGGGERRESLEERYLHGELTTEEYEDRKSHVISAH